MKRKVTPNTPVYAAAATGNFGNTEIHVVALTPTMVDKKIHLMMKHAAQDAYREGSYGSIRYALDAFIWSGVHSFTLKRIASNDEMDEAIDALEREGHWYPPRTNIKKRRGWTQT